jgi:hypothetical protein
VEDSERALVYESGDPGLVLGMLLADLCLFLFSASPSSSIQRTCLSVHPSTSPWDVAFVFKFRSQEH